MLFRRERSKRNDTVAPCSCAWRLAAGWVKPEAVGLNGSVPHEGAFSGGALEGMGFPVAYAAPGVVLALVFVTLPLVVRAVEPVLRELDPAEEEAAAMLGSSSWTTVRRVLLPPLVPAIAAGMVQTFARATAEFGSLSVVSGNIPFKTLTAPVYVLGEIEGGNVAGATVASMVLLVAALLMHGLGVYLGQLAGARHA